MSSSVFGLLALASVVLAQQNCVLQVPANPLSAQGLATPYKMSGCDQTQFATQACFVEAAILDPATGAVSIYNPLVINKNKAKEGVDFIAPVVPTLPANAVVGLFFGSNAVTLTLTGDTATCVNGDANGVFGQFAYCNTPAFFTAAFSAVSSGLLKIPPPGSTTKAATVQACPVTRDFRMVDMDQSDNVDSTYLLINGKMLAQNTPANAAKFKNATEIQNGSDNLLLNAFLAPTLGCEAGTFSAPCITCATGTSSAMALNELQSQFFVPAGGPALIPLNDDFTVDAGNNGNVAQSLIKTNLYRAGVGQPQAADAANASSVAYCTRYAESGLFIALNQKLFTGAGSPAPGASNNLFTFLANRFATSFGPVPSLGCETIFGLAGSPVTQTMDGNGVVIAATINTQILQNIVNGKTLPLGQTATSTSSVNTVQSTSTASKATTTLVKANTNTTTSLAATSTLAKANTNTTTTLASKTTSTKANSQTTTSLAATTTTLVKGNVNTTTSLASNFTATLVKGNVGTTTSLLTTSTKATSALATTTSISTQTTTILVEVVSFFIFVLNLGGVAPGVTGSIGSFIVLEEIFIDLPGAASAACTHQFNACAALAGKAFSGSDCLQQLNSCQGVASTASPTASTPATVTATATVPASTSNANAVATGAAQNNNNVAAPDTGASANCPVLPALTVSSCTASATATVTVTVSAGSGVASATRGVHRHGHLRHRAAEPLNPTIIPHWRA